MSSAPPLSRRPRVLQCLTHLALGGAEQVAFSLLRSLSADFDFGVFAVHGTAADEIGPALHRELADRNIPLFTGTRVPLRWGGMVTGGHALARAVRAFRPGLIHLHTEIPEACCAAMVALRLARQPAALVRTVHNSVYWHHWPRLGRWCERRLGPSHVAGVSEAARSAFAEARARSGAGPTPSAPIVIYNGVSTVATASPSAEERRHRPLRLLFAGRFEFQKGTDLLPEILARLRPPAGRPQELVLHGAGTHAGRLHHLAAHPPAGWSVKVLPPIANLAARMGDFDLVLVPSRFEGLGLVAVEAAMAGVPVVATDAPGLAEALPAGHPWHARAGDAASFAHTLQTALDARATWPVVAHAARQFAERRFALSAMADGYRALYARALD